MKNITIKLLSLFAVVLMMNGCGKADPILYSGPTFVSFTDGILGDYFIQADETPFNVQVGIPAPSGEAQTFNLSIVYSSGTDGTHFDLPETVTIPAGAVTADITISGHFDAMTGRKDTLVFGLSGNAVANFNNEYTLYLQQFCPFVIEEFIGDWTATQSSAWVGDYTLPITLSANPNGGDTLIADVIWGVMPTETVKVVFDASDASNFTWHIPNQYQFTDPDYGPADIVSNAPGPFSACEQIMGPIQYKVYDPAGPWDIVVMTMVKD